MLSLLPLALALVPPALPQVAEGHVLHAVPLGELELVAGSVMPSYPGGPPWQWSQHEAELPRAILEGPGECLYLAPSDSGTFWRDRPVDPLGALLIRTDEPRDVTGTLFVPRASGPGFTRLAFRVPASFATAREEDWLGAELQRAHRLLLEGVPGGAWFRHRHDELSTQLGLDASPAQPGARPSALRPSSDAFGLFTGGRALAENLQLERGLPAGDAAERSVALDTLAGLTVRAFDWKAHLAPEEPGLDPLARLIPADQHALFFPSFQGLVDVLDESARLGEAGLTAFEGRSTDARTRARYERQLCLALDEVARAFGPLVIGSVALTGSDPYLRSGSDVAVLLQVPSEHFERVYQLLRTRQHEAGFGEEPAADGVGWLTRSPTRGVSAHLFAVPGEDTSLRADFGGWNVIVVSNAVVQSGRILEVATGKLPALAATDEYRFFRQRYALGAEGESALLVLPDAAIRRWCSPRWRIGAARRTSAAAALAEEHAKHLPELLTDLEGERVLGPDPDFPDLGPLRLNAEGIQSVPYGTLDFLTPIIELALDHVTPREARLYEAWREGYQRAWSNFFDPIAARVAVAEDSTRVDLTVMPLILGTEYKDLRDATRGAGLEAGAGDPHPEALVRFAMGINRDWELFRSIGSFLGPMAETLGTDPLSWLGSWLAVYLDDAPIWEELLQVEELDEFRGLEKRLNEIPLVLTISVSNPLKLALFLTSLRALVDGTAPGMTEWKERVVGERRFVQIGSPGLGREFSLLYATTPGALILSLREETLLSAMARAEARQAGTAPPAEPATGAHAVFELRAHGLELFENFFQREWRGALQQACFANLPILNEWKRLHPELDPVALHERVFHERLTCPGGGEYVWNPEWATMESTVFGHPGQPKPGVGLPPAWAAFHAFRSQLTFEEDGLRVRLALERE